MKYFFILLIIQIWWTNVKSDIPNCDFFNTLNFSQYEAYSSTTDLSNMTKSLVTDYNYTILANGSRVNVETHKRYCICPDPCINFCSNDSIEIYRNYTDMKPSFTLEIKMTNDESILLDIVEHFNYAIRKPCQGYYLNTTSKPKDSWSLLEVNIALFLLLQNHSIH